MDTTQAIRNEATRLFETGEIDLFIGHEVGTVPPKARPFFVTAEEATENSVVLDRLVWNSFCSNNIAAYLQRYYENVPNRRRPREQPYPRVGIAVKGCDCRSVFTLIKEQQVRRECITLVGVPCSGMIDEKALRERVDGEIESVAESEEGSITVHTASGQAYELDREAVVAQACKECRFPVPEHTDVLLEGTGREPGDGGKARIEAFERKSSEEKWAYFETELSKCIRCNACRQACPTCWCRECFAEQTDLKWIGASAELSEAMVFQITRIFHQAGRCVSCDACYHACPMGVDLRTYTAKIVCDVDSLFGYVPDFDTETVPPLATFSETDSDDFITDPEQDSHG